MPRIRRLGSRDVLRSLREFGFDVVSLSDSQTKLVRVGAGRGQEILVVPRARRLAVGTLHAIYRRTRIFVAEDELRPRFYAD